MIHIGSNDASAPRSPDAAENASAIDETGICAFCGRDFGDLKCSACPSDDCPSNDDGGVLFNCCTNNAAPDWSQFKALEIGGCITETSGDDTWTSSEPDATAEFWTVYARHHSGEAEAITDCKTRDAAREVATTLSILSALPLLEMGV